MKGVLGLLEFISTAVFYAIGLAIGSWLYFWEYVVIRERSNYDHISVPE